MNRTDRLLAIVLELQAKKSLRAEDLAAIFEVTKRTIYRDVLALSEAGVPIVSMPGHGYSLVEGYFLPPLTFNTDEAIMLLLGADFAAQNFDAQYRTAAQSASRKIEAVLPEALRAEVRYLLDSIRFVATRVPGAPELLQQLRRAILQCRTVRFCYHARFSADKRKGAQVHDEHPHAVQASERTREADPYALIHIGGTWMLVAYCHLRHGIRHFRLDRMDDLALLDRRFIRPANVRIEEPREDDRQVVVRALFDPSVARWVRESRSFYQTAEEERSDGLLVTLKVRHEDEVFQWLLGWGAHIRVLEPDSLRERLADEAAQMLHNHVK
jgi:predicted DNA-binding transcriptional regulator YafY